jgi:hypothetical protein
MREAAQALLSAILAPICVVIEGRRTHREAVICFPSASRRKTENAMKLDAKTAAQVALPTGKADVIYFDDDLTGFGIRLRTASGDRIRRTWICQYRSHGRTRRLKIGALEKIGATQAREAARKVLARVELGHDPQGDKATRRRRGCRKRARCALLPRNI